MSTTPSLNSDAHNSPRRQLNLKVSTPRNDSHRQSTNGMKEESSSPIRPSYSPVTPTLSHAPLNQEAGPQQWIDEPEPLPVSLDDNPDAIALRATISLLQIQRQQTLRDIRSLDKTKQAAIDDPNAFVERLEKGDLQKPVQKGILFDDYEDDDEDSDRDGEVKTHPQEIKECKTENALKFSQLPNAQNIARCPPIEWSKYHIVGEPLNSLHELQKEYPGLTEEALSKGVQPRVHEIAAPYRPFVDKIIPSSSLQKHLGR